VLKEWSSVFNTSGVGWLEQNRLGRKLVGMTPHPQNQMKANDPDYSSPFGQPSTASALGGTEGRAVSLTCAAALSSSAKGRG